MNHLNAGFGELLGPDLAGIAALGFDGVRQDIPSPGKAAPLVEEFKGSGLVPLFVVGGGANNDLDRKSPEAILDACRATAHAIAVHLVGFDVAFIEVGNELDACPLYRSDPDRAGRLWQDADVAIREIAPTAGVVTGGITNLSPNAIEWLHHAINAAPALHPETIAGFHSYRENPQTPKEGFKDRDQEMAALRAAVRGADTWCTEAGYHTASKKGCLGRRVNGLNDAQVREYCYQEQDYFTRTFGIDLVWFQINDGPDDTPEHRYGIRRMDGTLKPVAGCFE